MSDPEKPKEEEKKPTKRSFVSEVQLRQEEEDKAVNEGKKVPSLEVTAVLIAEQLYDIKNFLGELVEVFKGTAKQLSMEKTTATVAPAPVPVAQPQNSKLAEVIKAFEPYQSLVSVDVDTSTMFVIIKPREFLGAENFAKIASLVKSLGGKYNSQGRESNFTIPKG